MKKITITSPDDWHCHLRDDSYLSRTVFDSAKSFRRVIVMPNLVPPILNVAQCQAYRKRIKSHIPINESFTPLMTLFLNKHTTLSELRTAKDSNFIVACKLYPAGATTYSDIGVKKLSDIFSQLETMQSIDLPLLIHGEITDLSVDIFDREKVFIERCLLRLIKKFPQLRIVLEHISTKEAVDFIVEAPDTIAATITSHHLLCNRNDLLYQGIDPHYYCLPILKTSEDQQALIKASISGNPKFFLGTDSAPHLKRLKETGCSCAGIYSAPVALQICTEIFEQNRALDKLEGFVSQHGAKFYGLSINTDKITLIKKPWYVPNSLSLGNECVVPLRAGSRLMWQIKHD